MDDHATALEFDGHAVILKVVDLSVDAVGQDDLGADREFGLQLFALFLQLTLGGDEEEVHGCDEEQHRGYAQQEITFSGSSCRVCRKYMNTNSLNVNHCCFVWKWGLRTP